jgi:hypothetical protein
LSDHNPDNDPNDGFPIDIPLIQGPLTPQEKKAQEKWQRREAKNASNQAFKDRQVTAIEAANRLSSRSFTISGVAAFIAALACIGTFYQGCMTRNTLETARETLTQMKADSSDSSRQFQAQLQHFDASLGVTQVIAGQATTQASQTEKLATDTHQLAITAGKQADAAREIATGTKSQSQSTHDIAVATNGQLETLRKQFELSQRAWIEITDSSVSLLEYPNPGGFSIYPKLVFKNSGNIPATNVRVIPWVFLPDQTKDIRAQAVEMQKRWCEQGKSNPSLNISIAQRIYPGRTKEYIFGFGGGDARTGGGN